MTRQQHPMESQAAAAAASLCLLPSGSAIVADANVLNGCSPSTVTIMDGARMTLPSSPIATPPPPSTTLRDSPITPSSTSHQPLAYGSPASSSHATTTTTTIVQNHHHSSSSPPVLSPYPTPHHTSNNAMPVHTINNCTSDMQEMYPEDEDMLDRSLQQPISTGYDVLLVPITPLCQPFQPTLADDGGMSPAIQSCSNHPTKTPAGCTHMTDNVTKPSAYPDRSQNDMTDHARHYCTSSKEDDHEDIFMSDCTSKSTIDATKNSNGIDHDASSSAKNVSVVAISNTMVQHHGGNMTTIVPQSVPSSIHPDASSIPVAHSTDAAATYSEKYDDASFGIKESEHAMMMEHYYRWWTQAMQHYYFMMPNHPVEHRYDVLAQQQYPCSGGGHCEKESSLTLRMDHAMHGSALHYDTPHVVSEPIESIKREETSANIVEPHFSHVESQSVKERTQALVPSNDPFSFHSIMSIPSSSQQCMTIGTLPFNVSTVTPLAPLHAPPLVMSRHGTMDRTMVSSVGTLGPPSSSAPSSSFLCNAAKLPPSSLTSPAHHSALQQQSSLGTTIPSTEKMTDVPEHYTKHANAIRAIARLFHILRSKLKGTNLAKNQFVEYELEARLGLIRYVPTRSTTSFPTQQCPPNKHLTNHHNQHFAVQSHHFPRSHHNGSIHVNNKIGDLNGHDDRDVQAFTGNDHDTNNAAVPIRDRIQPPPPSHSKAAVTSSSSHVPRGFTAGTSVEYFSSVLNMLRSCNDWHRVSHCVASVDYFYRIENGTRVRTTVNYLYEQDHEDPDWSKMRLDSSKHISKQLVDCEVLQYRHAWTHDTTEPSSSSSSILSTKWTLAEQGGKIDGRQDAAVALRGHNSRDGAICGSGENGLAPCRVSVGNNASSPTCCSSPCSAAPDDTDHGNLNVIATHADHDIYRHHDDQHHQAHKFGVYDLKVALYREEPISPKSIPPIINETEWVRLKMRQSFEYKPKDGKHPIWRIDMTQSWGDRTRSGAEQKYFREPPVCEIECELLHADSFLTQVQPSDTRAALHMILKIVELFGNEKDFIYFEPCGPMINKKRTASL